MSLNRNITSLVLSLLVFDERNFVPDILSCWRLNDYWVRYVFWIFRATVDHIIMWVYHLTPACHCHVIYPLQPPIRTLHVTRSIIKWSSQNCQLLSFCNAVILSGLLRGWFHSVTCGQCLSHVCESVALVLAPAAALLYNSEMWLRPHCLMQQAVYLTHSLVVLVNFSRQ